MLRLAASAALTAVALGTSSSTAFATTAQYGGGALLTNVHVVLVAWGTSVPAAYLSKDKAMLPDLSKAAGATNNFLSILPEYSVSSPVAYKLRPGITYDGERTITPSQCTSTANPCDDTKIQAELKAQIAAGHLPAPRGANGLSTAYLVLMPQGMTVSFQGSYSGQQFCTYHYATTTQSNANLVYAVLPDVFSNGTGCGTQSAAADNETGGLSRELVDVITDPINNTGWADFNFNDCPLCGDLGDMCYSQPSATNTLNGHSYNVSEIWSQREDLCVASSNYHAPTASFTSKVKLKTVAFSATAASQNGGSITSYRWSFGDGKTGVGAHPSHTYAAARTYTVILTVTDSLGFVKRVRHTVKTI